MHYSGNVPSSWVYRRDDYTIGQVHNGRGVRETSSLALALSHVEEADLETADLHCHTYYQTRSSFLMEKKILILQYVGN